MNPHRTCQENMDALKKVLTQRTLLALSRRNVEFVLAHQADSNQQLADYLGVERSALSNELSKMQKDGIIRYEKIILRSWPPVRCARTQLISGIIEKYCRVSVPRQGRLSDPDASCCPDSKFPCGSM